jgi:hypothetical protein
VPPPATSSSVISIAAGTPSALPEATCQAVYATKGYEQSVQNLAQTSLDSDMVFSDGYASELARTSGDPGSTITVKLNVGV